MTLLDDLKQLRDTYSRSADVLREFAEEHWASGQTEKSTKFNDAAGWYDSFACELDRLIDKHDATTQTQLAEDAQTGAVPPVR